MDLEPVVMRPRQQDREEAFRDQGLCDVGCINGNPIAAYAVPKCTKSYFPPNLNSLADLAHAFQRRSLLARSKPDLPCRMSHQAGAASMALPARLADGRDAPRSVETAAISQVFKTS